MNPSIIINNTSDVSQVFDSPNRINKLVTAEKVNNAFENDSYNRLFKCEEM